MLDFTTLATSPQIEINLHLGYVACGSPRIEINLHLGFPALGVTFSDGQVLRLAMNTASAGFSGSKRPLQGLVSQTSFPDSPHLDVSVDPTPHQQHAPRFTHAFTYAPLGECCDRTHLLVMPPARGRGVLRPLPRRFLMDG
jgi:hypothetical protein